MKYSFFLCLFIICSCQTNSKKLNKKIDKKDISGIWIDNNNGKMLFFNDTLCLMNSFYPYSRWKISYDTLLVHDIEADYLLDSLWVKFRIEDISDEKMFLRRLEENEEEIYSLNKVQHEQKFKCDSIVFNIYYHLNYAPVFSVSINMNSRNLELMDGMNSESVIRKNCSLKDAEFLELNTILSFINWESLPKQENFISNMTYVYYLKLNIFNNGQVETAIILDTGSQSPLSIQNVITYIWSTSRLICTPHSYAAFSYYE